MSFERLMSEHDQLDQTRTRLLRLVTGPAVPVEAIRLLAEFSVGIEQHRAFEQAFVYEPLLRIAQTKPLPPEVDLEGLIDQMDGDWANYLHDWDLETISADWANFAAETERVLERAGQRMQIENDLIYPLALQRGTIPLKEQEA